MRSNPAEPATGPDRNPMRIAGFAAAALTAAGFILLLLLMLSIALRRGVNHDEIQHLAAGAVVGRRFLLPYRDFPYFHMPDLVLVYGALFRLCGSLLLGARILSVAAGWLTLLLVWFIVRRECRGKPWAARWLLPAAAALLLFSNPIFREAFWRTWNHALGTLCGVAAFALAMRPGRGWRWFWAGVFIGLAIGTRLTFAPFGAPLAAAALWEPGGESLIRRARNAASVCAGAALALLPSLILFAMAPAQFLFGNFSFNSKFNVLFRQSYHDQRATLRSKLLFPFTTLLADKSNLVLALIFVPVLAAALIRVLRMPANSRYRLLLVLSIIPFALIGAIAASPSQQEYYYAMMPFLVLAASLSAAAFCEGEAAWILPTLLLALAILTTAWTWDEYQRIAILKTPAVWPAVKLHEAGLEAKGLVGDGRVLTLNPLIPLEGGLDIYPELVTEGIAWRTEPFIPPADRIRFRILGPDNFAAAMEKTPPAAILTTPSSGLDGPLIAWAHAHGYLPHLLQPRGKLVDQATVWTPPR